MFGLPIATTWLVFGVPVFWVLYTLGFFWVTRNWPPVRRDEPTELHPMLVGVVLSSLTMIAVSLATQRSHPVPAHILKAMSETAELRPLPRGLRANQDFTMAHEALGLR